ncbi:hypothetical protein [Cyanobium sp. WAJ14-Wanaka]|uniref:glycosyltransferase family protein n=1 Tax=Cyanobium sp. WAJ14-Wanaka TaxID=2823725 RepID=UPI0020CFC56C|nr:hypothetical protein [Cyanobium sp. WAJ14-Wanaka]MCP9775653.1 hypothetical protein [Cyanobium sp. WAJ14-Wanaka]
MNDHPLRIEVLVNSPGPHDQVRIREPFKALQQQGLDCRIHERPFRFSSCIRPHSLVIWQRPLPESRQRQWEHLQWLRERGCLLLTEWDDHPDLFPEPIQTPLRAIALAPLQLCHALHTSSPRLANALRPLQPLALVLENSIAQLPPLDLAKHTRPPLRLLIANQNRSGEHQAISQALAEWAKADPSLQLVVIGDRALAQRLPAHQLEFHPTLPYQHYRAVLASCQIALLPLEATEANACKTPIKLLECAAASVATVCGPGLYSLWAPAGVTRLVTGLEQVVPEARSLAENPAERRGLVARAHSWVGQQWQLQGQLPWRLWLYQELWRRRRAVDARLVERINAYPAL